MWCKKKQNINKQENTDKWHEIKSNKPNKIINVTSNHESDIDKKTKQIYDEKQNNTTYKW